MQSPAIIVLDQLKKHIYLMNLKYGVGSAKNIRVSLKLRNKLPSEHFKTKKDFLEPLKEDYVREFIVFFGLWTGTWPRACQ